MARFYVVKGRRILWNAVVLLAAVVILVYVFNVEETDLNQEAVEPQEVLDNTPAMARYEETDPLEFISLAEHVSVKTVPTKFTEYRLERERVRSRKMELLQNTAYDGTVAAEQRLKAQDELHQLIATMAQETEIENLLKAKGYVDGVVVLDEESAIVVVPARLSRDEASQIGELVNRLTGIRFENITIVDEPMAV